VITPAFNIEMKICTSLSRVLLEKLIGSQIVRFLAFYGTRRFIIVFTRVRHLSQINPVYTLPALFL
jgi:hypothetical protein